MSDSFSKTSAAKSPLLDQLIAAFCVLPGVGKKSAQRMVFHLLERDRHGAQVLAEKLTLAMEAIRHCQVCRTFTENEVCDICSNKSRNRSQLCIVETPVDALVLEQSGIYRGLYFVLMGRLSPLDGIGPKELGIDILQERLQDDDIKEVILATNATVEGEATAHYISELVRETGITVSRIAHGVPLGGELEYIDGHTLSHAFSERRIMGKLI